MRILGWLAAILGVVGLVICLAIAIGVWFVRPEVSARVDRVAEIAADGLDQAAILSTEASDLVVQVNERLDTVATTAQTIADSPLVDTVVGRALSAAITNLVSGPWTEIQDRLSGMRERVVSISNVVQSLDEAIPAISLPGVVTGFVDDVDARWTELDETVQTIETVASNGISTSEQAARIAQAATTASERLDAVGAALSQVHGRIETAQADIDQASDQIDSLLTMIAVVVTIVAIWVGLLHVLLVSQGRRWLREADATRASTASTTAAPGSGEA